MNNDRLTAGGGDFHLARKDGLLHLSRRVVIKIVEADLSAGQDLRLPQQTVELGESSVVSEPCFVGMDAGRGPDLRHSGAAREFAADLKRAMHRLRSVADAD